MEATLHCYSKSEIELGLRDKRWGNDRNGVGKWDKRGVVMQNNESTVLVGCVERKNISHWREQSAKSAL